MNDPLFSSMFDLVNPGQLLPMTGGGTDLNRLSSASTLIRSPKIRLDFGETPNLYLIKADLPGCTKIDGKSQMGRVYPHVLVLSTISSENIHSRWKRAGH